MSHAGVEGMWNDLYEELQHPKFLHSKIETKLGVATFLLI